MEKTLGCGDGLLFNKSTLALWAGGKCLVHCVQCTSNVLSSSTVAAREYSRGPAELANLIAHRARVQQVMCIDRVNLYRPPHQLYTALPLPGPESLRKSSPLAAVGMAASSKVLVASIYARIHELAQDRNARPVAVVGFPLMQVISSLLLDNQVRSSQRSTVPGKVFWKIIR